MDRRNIPRLTPTPLKRKKTGFFSNNRIFFLSEHSPFKFMSNFIIIMNRKGGVESRRLEFHEPFVIN